MMEKLIQSRGDGSKKQKAVGSRPADDAVATSARHMHTHTLTQAYTRTQVRTHTPSFPCLVPGQEETSPNSTNQEAS